MTSHEKLQEYLWDPDAPADPDVEDLERRFEGLRFDPAAKPLDPSRRPAPVLTHRARWRRPLVAAAIAASLIIATGAGLWTWRSSWPEGRAWTVRADAIDAPLEVGRPLTIPATGSATANIGRIGTMRLDAGTSLELRSTRGTRHRLSLTAGTMHVRVWAPPGSVVIATPAGEVIDMGCEFIVSVAGRVTSLRVLSGWVQLDNGIGEVLVPAGASTEMDDSRGPGVPVFDDAPAGFREGVRAYERNEDDGSAVRVIALARARDVYTLLHIADRHPFAAESLLRRAAELSPPPEGITIAGILRGNRQHLWRWANAQPLPPPKGSWWRNWRDALPVWMVR
jgi:hypothetical protein